MQIEVQTPKHDGQRDCGIVETGHCPVSTMPSPKYGLLSKIVKSFKEISVKTIRKNYNDYQFAWQRSFYDRIIRKEDALDKIRQYIYHNPAKWEFDKNNIENIWM